MKMTKEEMFVEAAKLANGDSIKPENRREISDWIWHNCEFPLECYTKIIDGIQTELLKLRGTAL